MTRPEVELADPGSFAPIADPPASTDPLGWPEYGDILDNAKAGSGVDESVRSGPATLDGHAVELALFDFGFLGGSMGEVAGERLARGLERAGDRGVPFVLRTATGGARMQEGMASLTQMPKVTVARRRFAGSGQAFLVVLGHPTTGGVLASVASLADVTVAEAEATIGFAGPRVAESFTGRSLEGDSHTATTAFRHGLVDEVVPVDDVRSYLAQALDVLAPDDPQPVPEPGLPARRQEDPWDLVEAARQATRPSGEELLRAIADPVLPLRGDRSGSDDPALFAAIARIRGRRAVALALEPAHAPGPGAYRKARRCLDIAGRLRLPVVTLVDTRGADPSPASENKGIAGEIATTMDALLNARVPTLSLITGEGGSGGALAFAVTDGLLAMATSVFSVIGPEGAAQILWRDATRAPEAARLLRLASHDLVELGIADALVPDEASPAGLADVLAYHLDRIASLGDETRSGARYDRWRRRI